MIVCDGRMSSSLAGTQVKTTLDSKCTRLFYDMFLYSIFVSCLDMYGVYFINFSFKKNQQVCSMFSLQLLLSNIFKRGNKKTKLPQSILNAALPCFYPSFRHSQHVPRSWKAMSSWPLGRPRFLCSPSVVETATCVVSDSSRTKRSRVTRQKRQSYYIMRNENKSSKTEKPSFVVELIK